MFVCLYKHDEYLPANNNNNNSFIFLSTYLSFITYYLIFVSINICNLLSTAFEFGGFLLRGPTVAALISLCLPCSFAFYVLICLLEFERHGYTFMTDTDLSLNMFLDCRQILFNSILYYSTLYYTL